MSNNNKMTEDPMEAFVNMAIHYFKAGISSTTLELERPYGLACKVKIEVSPIKDEQ